MNEWKELQIDNLPPDILTGGYEWEFWNEDEWEILTEFCGVHFDYVKGDSFKYRYRKPEPKAPTTTEILSNWWMINGCWYRVIAYNPVTEKYGFINDYWVYYPEFAHLESATIPEE